MPLQPLGTPRHLKAHLNRALTSRSIFFFLAYILQQYRNTLLYTETWRCRSSGSGAVPVPVPAGSAVPAPRCQHPTASQHPTTSQHPTASQPGAGSWGLAGAWELPTAPTTPLACTGDPGYPACPRGPSQPGSGRSISPLPSSLYPVRAQSAARRWRAVFQPRPFSQPWQAATKPRSKPGYGTCWERVSGGCHRTNSAQSRDGLLGGGLTLCHREE